MGQDRPSSEAAENIRRDNERIAGNTNLENIEYISRKLRNQLLQYKSVLVETDESKTVELPHTFRHLKTITTRINLNG